MSGEQSGLRRILKHEAPPSKYVICRNHRLAFVFVHFVLKFESLQEVDTNILQSGSPSNIDQLRHLFSEKPKTYKGSQM